MSTTKHRWEIILHRRVEGVLRRLPRGLQQRIDQAIMGLANDPRPPGCSKLRGYDNLYRLRVGSWRVSYAVEDAQLIVLIIEVAPRGGAYRF
jgi:mRNA interferase RelE/StbE